MNLTIKVIDETINVSVSVTEMKVPVYLVNEIGGNLENVSVANVSNDTTPEPTDKLFLWRAEKGWFYRQFGNFLHNLFGGRDVADCHPAKAITFDVDPVPDLTAVAKGNTLEAITHKVAGLQKYTYTDTLSEDVTAKLVISKDINDADISIEEGQSYLLDVRLFLTAGSGGVFIVFNSEESETDKYSWATVAKADNIPLLSLAATYTELHSQIFIHLLHGEVRVNAFSHVGYDDNATVNGGVVYARSIGKNLTAINKMTLLPNRTILARSKLVLTKL